VHPAFGCNAKGIEMLGRTSAAFAALLCCAPASALPIAPGFIVSFVDVATGAAVGDVVAVGGTIFVGVGPQNQPGAGVLVRVDGAGTPGQTETVVAEGFTSFAGMDFDAAGGRLLVADNGLEFGGPTGDNVYAVTDPFGTPLDPPDARELRILLDGDVPGAADVLVDPLDPDHLFITDASAVFPPAGRLLEASIAGGSASLLEGGLGFAAGLASDGSTLWVGEVDGSTFEGIVSGVPLASPGSGLVPLVAGLAGQLDLELSADGTLLSSSGGEILRIDPTDGSTTVVASGFGFATGLWEDADGAIYVLDGFASGVGEPANRVWVLTLIPEPATGLLLATGLAALAARSCVSGS
jgi:hypothetical protein